MDEVWYSSRSVSKSRGFAESEALSRRTSLGAIEREEQRQFTDQNQVLFTSMKEVVKGDEKLKEIFSGVKLARNLKLDRNIDRVKAAETSGTRRS